MRSKAERHRAIQEIVSREEIGTQKELVERLRQLGFDVTQATVSRDIAELRLARVALGKGRHRYALPSLELPEDAYEELRRQFGLFVKDVDRGGNILVVKTAEGHASGIALLIDRLRRDGIVGTLAGEDTILVVGRTEGEAEALEEEFGQLLLLGKGLRRGPQLPS
ncbi:arginine repressor [Thermus thermamylovorans]|uniref:Arginine repressor n=1 Tax=Thermus thermamylovorans TaxID=2509362 RepID=A0A4Q9B7X6_9DEIN|nr:arginine repressor [Thermus thermamylovorans]TBH20927.1 arginine repressor [Thermus thermamylovorans]